MTVVIGTLAFDCMKASKQNPKYQVIVEDILNLIKSGDIKAGEKVPSENTIIAQYNVSNVTARKALSVLEQRGIVKRIRGKGTIALENSKGYITRALGSFSAMCESFEGNLIADGIKPLMCLEQFKEYRGKVNIQVGSNFYEIVGKIVKIRILRYGNSKLLKDEVFYFDASQIKIPPSVDSLDSPVLFIEKSSGFSVRNVDRNIFATLVEGGKTSVFKNAKLMPALALEGAFLLENGKCVAIEKSTYRGDVYKFSINSNS